MSPQYDLLIVGGGPGGYVAAIRAAQLGLRTALAERDQLGGTCLNRGCVPTKALLHAASLYASLSEMKRWGIETQPAALDSGSMFAQKEAVLDQQRSGVERLLEAHHVEVLRGQATVTAPGALTVRTAEGEALYHAKHILLATGSVPAALPLPGFDNPAVVTSDGLLAGPDLPERLVVVGGGVIGVEMAFLLASLGKQVTLLEALPALLAGADADIQQNLLLLLRAQGITVATGARVLSAARQGAQLTVAYEHKSEALEAPCDRVLVAVGRKPDTKDLFGGAMTPPEMAGPALRVDSSGRTSIPGLWAIGDVTGGLQLAHYASAMGIRAVQAMTGTEESSLGAIPACVYTEPEIAWVGQTEREAKEQGLEVVTHRHLLSGNARQVITGGPRSFIKLVAEAGSHRLIGAHLMCPRASDLIGFFALAMDQGVPAADLARVVQPHPSFAEGIHEALSGLLGQAIHEPPRRR